MWAANANWWPWPKMLLVRCCLLAISQAHRNRISMSEIRDPKCWKSGDRKMPKFYCSSRRFVNANKLTVKRFNSHSRCIQWNAFRKKSLPHQWNVCSKAQWVGIGLIVWRTVSIGTIIFQAFVNGYYCSYYLFYSA